MNDELQRAHEMLAMHALRNLDNFFEEHGIQEEHHYRILQTIAKGEASSVEALAQEFFLDEEAMEFLSEQVRIARPSIERSLDQES